MKKPSVQEKGRGHSSVCQLPLVALQLLVRVKEMKEPSRARSRVRTDSNQRGQASGTLEPASQGLPPVDTIGEAKARDPTKAGVSFIPSTKRVSISAPGVVPGTCFSFN